MFCITFAHLTECNIHIVDPLNVRHALSSYMFKRLNCEKFQHLCLLNIFRTECTGKKQSIFQIHSTSALLSKSIEAMFCGFSTKICSYTDAWPFSNKLIQPFRNVLAITFMRIFTIWHLAYQIAVHRTYLA